MARYIVSTWDGYSVVCPSWRRAKVVMRRADRETYCTWVKRYRGTRKIWTEVQA